MRIGLALPAKLAEQIEHILVDLHRKTEAECVLLADVSGRLISVQGQTPEVDPVLMAVVGAADVVATTELIRQIGEQDPSSALLREGKHVNVYLFDVAGRFVLIVIFRTGMLANLVCMYGRRAVERLRPLAAELENQMNESINASAADPGASPAEETDVTFERTVTRKVTGVTKQTKQKISHRGAEKWRRLYLDAHKRSRKVFRVFKKVAEYLRRTPPALEQQPPGPLLRHRDGEPGAVSGGGDQMRTGMAQPTRLAEQIERILVDLRGMTKAECVLLADVSGQLISVQGRTQEINPVLMAVLGAADVMATAELIQQIGGQDTGGALFRQGKQVNVYLFDVAGHFILIVIFRASTLAALVRTFGGRTAKRLRPLAAEFEDWMNKAIKVSDIKFGATLAEEMDKVFEGL